MDIGVSQAMCQEDASMPAGCTVQTARGPILFLMSSFIMGGSERKTVRIANELHRKGWKVHVAYLNPPTTLLASLDRGIPVCSLGRRGKFSLRSARALMHYIGEQGITHIISINLYPLLYALLARAMLGVGAKPKVVLTINTTHHHGIKERLSMAFYRSLINRPEQVVFGCRAQLDLWCSRYDLKKRRCLVIYNGVDSEEFFAPAAEANVERSIDGASVGSEALLIGCIGGFRPVKNQIELIRVLSSLKDKIPGVHLVLVGDGPERQNLEDAAAEAGVAERVWFLGSRSDVRPVLEVLDIIVVPSISETFSNAALEAMSMGKPVILSDTGGAREMVDHGVSGYLYQQGDDLELAGMLEELAAHPERRIAVGKNARRAVLARFSLSGMVGEYERLFLAPPGQTGGQQDELV